MWGMLSHSGDPARTEDPGRLLTIQEVAERLTVSRATVRRLIQTGQLPRIKVGGSVRFEAPDVQALIERGKSDCSPTNDEGPACQPDPVTTPAGRGQQRAAG